MRVVRLTRSWAITAPISLPPCQRNENVGSALDVAQKLASSRSVQDMVKIQTEFAQTHAKRIVEQTNENLSLAMKAGSDAFSSWSSAFTGRASK